MIKLNKAKKKINNKFGRLINFMEKLYYLYPERPDTNPSSLFKEANVSKDKFTIQGFKLYAFLDCLDTADSPFWVAPVKAEGKSVTFYQYQFPRDPPAFEQYGFKMEESSNGKILYLSQQQFVFLSAKLRSISVKSGNWISDEYNHYHSLAAFAHLDILPQLSKKYIRNQSLRDLGHSFQRQYSLTSSIPITLPSFYEELVNILTFFGFSFHMADSSQIHKNDFYYFGSLIECLSEFHQRCFPHQLLGYGTITPGAIKQLRAMVHFVRMALSKIAIDPGDDITRISQMVDKLKLDNEIDEKGCGPQTMQLLWRLMLSKSSDPINALLQARVSLDLNINKEDDKFGSLEGKNCGVVGKKLTDGISTVITKLSAPSSVMAKAQNMLITTTREAAKDFQEIGNGVSNLQEKLEKVTEFALGIKEEVSQSSERAEVSIRIVDGLDQMNATVAQKVIALKQKIDREAARTNFLTLLIVLLVALIVFQWFTRKNGISGMNQKKNV